MSKRHQLNINVDESLMKELKMLALQENLALSVFIRNSLREMVSSKQKESSSRNSFTEKHALNCTSFMRALFQKKRTKYSYANDLEAFNELIKYIETYSQWNDSYTKRMKEVLLEISGDPWTAQELNRITKDRECECPIYVGLKEWTGCLEYPTQDLICNLGGSLVQLIENQI